MSQQKQSTLIAGGVGPVEVEVVEAAQPLTVNQQYWASSKKKHCVCDLELRNNIL